MASTLRNLPVNHQPFGIAPLVYMISVSVAIAVIALIRTLSLAFLLLNGISPHLMHEFFKTLYLHAWMSGQLPLFSFGLFENKYGWVTPELIAFLAILILETRSSAFAGSTHLFEVGKAATL
jgi:hypothetical protein